MLSYVPLNTGILLVISIPLKDPTKNTNAVLDVCFKWPDFLEKQEKKSYILKT